MPPIVAAAHRARPGFPAYAVLIGLLALAPAPRAEAQRPWSVEVDNDALNSQPLAAPTDAEYTHGMRLRLPRATPSPLGRWLFGGIPGCGAHGSDGPCQDWNLVVGQEIYTPRLGHVPRTPGDRAYAGWLGASMQTLVHTSRIEHGLSLTVGVTGPPSLAGAFQRSLHRLVGWPKPTGWNAQLGTEPTVDIAYDGSADLVRMRMASGLGARITPLWAASLGTVHREAALGMEVALELGAQGASRWRTSTALRSEAGFYLLSAFRERAVAGNFFLDGGFFRDGQGVGHRPFVRVWELGAGARIHGMGLEWRMIKSSREYATQAVPHTYVTLALVR
jgi:hypothetical protein